MTPQIITSTEKKLVGKHMYMSFANYKIAELWKNFMPHRNKITHQISNNLISLAIYKPDHFLKIM